MHPPLADVTAGHRGPLDRVWYHLFPLGWLGGERHNPSPGMPGGPISHRLPALIDDLDRIAELGVGGVLLGPVFESESHGYDTVDPFRIDRRLGDEADLVALADACHTRGLALALDGVFHHVGRTHPRFQAVLREGPTSAAASWFHIDAERDGPDGFGYADFEGHRQLVRLRHDQPEVRQWAIDVVRYWSDRGVDGWRLDAAYAIPAEFIAALVDATRAAHPDAFFLGEVIHGDYTAFASATGLDSVTQYELWKSIWSSLNDRNLFELAHALGRHQRYCESLRPWTFIGNHDTTRIASKLDDARHLGHAIALLLTLPGVPAIYAGDESGALGVKRDEEWGDDDVRRPVVECGTIDQRGEVTDLYRTLAGVRADHPWMATAAVSVADLANEHAVVTITGSGGSAHLGLVVGDGRRPAPPGTHVAGEHGDQISGHSWTLRLEPRPFG